MWDLFTKIKSSLHTIEQEKGAFEVKCLVAKDLSNLQWDLILTADWFDKEPYNDLIKLLDYLSEKILRDLDINCMIQFSGIITYTVNTHNALLDKLRIIQENHRIGKYKVEPTQGYLLLSFQELSIIPLNDSEV